VKGVCLPSVFAGAVREIEKARENEGGRREGYEITSETSLIFLIVKSNASPGIQSFRGRERFYRDIECESERVENIK